jgi:Tetratricopeptide repeat
MMGHLRESQCELVADGGCRCVLSSTESRDPPMAEILTLGLTHYPPLCLPDQEMAGILSWTLNDPSIPAAGSYRPSAAHYGAALTLASELGMRPLVAHCHLGLGKLYRRIGNREPAREHLQTATTMYREMDVRLWREQAETAIAEVG